MCSCLYKGAVLLYSFEDVFGGGLIVYGVYVLGRSCGVTLYATVIFDSVVCRCWVRLGPGRGGWGLYQFRCLVYIGSMYIDGEVCMKY